MRLEKGECTLYDLVVVLGLILQTILTGFVVKSIASFDDTLTRIPLLSELTRGRTGKIAFSVGTLLALTITLLVAIFFSSLLSLTVLSRYIISALILLLGLAVYFETFSHKKEEKVQQRLIQAQTISRARFLRLVGIGFVISLITYLDDMIVMVPLFLGDETSRLFSLIGVYLAALVQITIVIYFSRQISKIKYKKEIASLGLIILAVLVGLGVV